MKNNQPDPDIEEKERTTLASLAVFVGLLVVAFLVLVLTLGSKPPQQTPAAAASPAEPAPQTATMLPEDNVANALQQKANLLATEQPKSNAKKRLRAPSNSRTSKSNKAYTILVTPGKSPRMTEVQ